MRKIKISIIIPTYNAGGTLSDILNKLPANIETLIIDSSSSDNTTDIAKSFNCKVNVIDKKAFNHGGTRNVAARIATGDILVFLTQDAIPVGEEAIEKITSPFFEDESIGMAYGRQLPHKNAKIMGSFARLHNYPEKSIIKSFKDKDSLGIKTVFCSNSFAAYRREAFEKVGMFPNNVILSEDTYVCAKMILADYKVAYTADATVYHSHDYSIIEEFKRYFDIGVFYGREGWIVNEFSQAEGEGIKFVLEQFKFLLKNKASHLIIELFLRNAMKYIGYKLGQNEERLALKLKKAISMHKGYWETK
ncbi:glycosyltransferase family 2 protein [Priestia sp. FSL W8-0524]|uniref:glycosyltransferase family 2 protein n=1 Tax=Priestia sp. FSL W8-0524 TaxID=2954625 RepID=UPI0030F62779